MTKYKFKWKTLIISITLPLLVGFLSALISRDGMTDFNYLDKPPLSPPPVLFPIVWTLLYILMGISFYLVLRNPADLASKREALKLYFISLFLNFLWSPVFFGLGAYWVALLLLGALYYFVIATAVAFFKIAKPAGLLFIPYILWLSFAAYLNLAIAFLN